MKINYFKLKLGPSVFLYYILKKFYKFNFAGGKMSDCYKCISDEICTECKNNKILDSERKGCDRLL